MPEQFEAFEQHEVVGLGQFEAWIHPSEGLKRIAM